MGVRLFDRTPNGLLLTSAGRDLARACTAGFGRVNESWERIASGGPQRLRIAAPAAWSALWLVPRLGRFLADWPDLRVDIEGGNLDRPAESEAGWAVIRYVRGGDGIPDGIKLSDEPLFPVCAPMLCGDLTEPADLARHRLLHFRDSPDWSLWRAATGTDSIVTSQGLSFSDSVMVMQAAMAGHGVALGRPSLVLDALEEGRLVRPFGPVVPVGDCYVLTAPVEGRGRRVLREFRRWLLDEATADVQRARRLRIGG